MNFMYFIAADVCVVGETISANFRSGHKSKINYGEQVAKQEDVAALTTNQKRADNPFGFVVVDWIFGGIL